MDFHKTDLTPKLRKNGQIPNITYSSFVCFRLSMTLEISTFVNAKYNSKTDIAIPINNLRAVL